MSGLTWKKKFQVYQNRWIYYTCSVSLTLKSCCNFSTFRSKSNHFSWTFCFSRETEATFDRSSSTLNNKYHQWKYIHSLFAWQNKEPNTHTCKVRFLPGVPTSFRQEFSKKIAKCYEKRKNSWKFVYILAKQCRSHFNLTNIFDKKIQNSNFAQIWDSH